MAKWKTEEEEIVNMYNKCMHNVYIAHGICSFSSWTQCKQSCVFFVSSWIFPFVQERQHVIENDISTRFAKRERNNNKTENNFNLAIAIFESLSAASPFSRHSDSIMDWYYLDWNIFGRFGENALDQSLRSYVLLEKVPQRKRNTIRSYFNYVYCFCGL